MPTATRPDPLRVLIEDADRNLSIEVRFDAPHAHPILDARRPRMVLDCYERGGTSYLRDRFGPDNVRVS
jgi:hypothetical protein